MLPNSVKGDDILDSNVADAKETYKVCWLFSKQLYYAIIFILGSYLFSIFSFQYLMITAIDVFPLVKVRCSFLSSCLLPIVAS